jgi:hypothetical protein
MDRKFKTFFLGTFLAAVLLAPASGWAKDYWHWSKDANRWDHRADRRSDAHDLEEARRQLNYDRSHHAHGDKISEHEARIRDIERDLHFDRRAQR